MKNSLYIKSFKFDVSEEPNSMNLQRTSAIKLKDLNFDKLYLVKKFAILIRLVSYLEFLNTNEISYSLDDILLYQHFEIEIRKDYAVSSYNTMITQFPNEKYESTHYLQDFLFIYEKMFPFLINSDMQDSVTDSINCFAEIKKLLYELILFAIRLDNNIILLKSQYLLKEKEHLIGLRIIEEFLSVQTKSKITANSKNIEYLIKSNNFTLKSKKYKEEYIMSHEIELTLKKELNKLIFVKEINLEFANKNYNSGYKKNLISLSRDSSPETNLKLHSKKRIFEEDINPKDLPKIAMTESNAIKETDFNQHDKTNLRRVIVKKKHNTNKDLDYSEQIQSLKNNVLPNISNVVYKSLNFESEESNNKRDLKIMNMKMYLDYKKNNIVEKKNNVHHIFQSLSKNSVIGSRLDSGKNNIRSILKDYSSFNRDYISRIFSPKQKYSEQFNFFDEKPKVVLKKDFFKDNNLISKNKI